MTSAKGLGFSALLHLSLIILAWSMFSPEKRAPQYEVLGEVYFEEKAAPQVAPPPKEVDKSSIRSQKKKTKVKVKPKVIPPKKKVAPTSKPKPTAQAGQAGGDASGAGLLKAQINERGYQALLRRKVQARWKAPLAADEYSILVRCLIDSSGRVDQLEIKESSGFDLLDQAAKKAILSSMPLPAPPKELLDSTGGYEALFRFDPEER